jgi:hypothetical protein
MAQDMEDTTESGGARSRIPPYIPFSTLLTFLGELKTNGIPPQIDKSVLRRFSGGVQSQLRLAIKAMVLVDDSYRPTPRLAEMVEKHETPDFEAVLAAVMREVYPYVFKLDLMTATPTMFADAFKETGAKEDVSRKCRTFFLHAAKRANIPLGQRILTGSVPRTASTNTRKKTATARKNGNSPETDLPPPPHPPPATVSNSKPLEYQLIDLMSEPDIVADVKTSIWSLVQYLMDRKAKSAVSKSPAADQDNE